MRRKWIPFAFLPLAGLAAAAVPALRGNPPTGTPDISGNWTGKLQIKDFDLGTDGTKEVRKCACAMTAAQTGPLVTLTMTVECPGSTPEVFTLFGLIGSGHFAAEQKGSLEGGPEEVLLSGTVTGNGTKMKGVGVLVADSGGEVHVGELKFNAKLLSPPK